MKEDKSENRKNAGNGELPAVQDKLQVERNPVKNGADVSHKPDNRRVRARRDVSKVRDNFQARSFCTLLDR